MTPYTWRNFVTGASTAKEGQLDRFFLQKRHFIYKLSMKKQDQDRKRAKTLQKRLFLSALLQNSTKVAAAFTDCPEKLQQFLRCFLQKRHFIYKLSLKKQETGQKTGKNPPKKVFLSFIIYDFSSRFLLLNGQFVYEMPFMQLFHLTFSSRRRAGNKVPPHI